MKYKKKEHPGFTVHRVPFIFISGNFYWDRRSRLNLWAGKKEQRTHSCPFSLLKFACLFLFRSVFLLPLRAVCLKTFSFAWFCMKSTEFPSKKTQLQKNNISVKLFSFRWGMHTAKGKQTYTHTDTQRVISRSVHLWICKVIIFANQMWFSPSECCCKMMRQANASQWMSKWQDVHCGQNAKEKNP